MNRLRIWIAGILALLVSGSYHVANADTVHAANLPTTEKITIYFRTGDALVLLDYKGNKTAFDKLHKLIKNEAMRPIDSITICGYTSPEGGVSQNEKLAKERAVNLRGTLRWRYPALKHLPIITSYKAESWNVLLSEIEDDRFVPRRDEVLTILRSGANDYTKQAKLQQLPDGAYEYIRKNILPELRTAVSCIVYFHDQSITEVAQEEEVVEVITMPETPVEPVAVEPQPEKEEVTSIILPIKERRPLLALKTNLLFDVATLINLELEVPIGHRWSIAAEAIFPWWLQEDKQRCIQMLSGNLEGRYWFGDRRYDRRGREREPLTGWFAGLYAGGGYYDLEWDARGYQGEFFIAAGISGGYSHRIGRNLRMEYSLGVGYMQTNYRYYEAEKGFGNEWHLTRQNDGRFTWIGPTRAKVSLVWLINYHKKRGGVR